MSLSDGVRVLLLTTVCYLLTFSYELGYFKYFNLPSELININIKTLITFGFSFISITVICIIPASNIICKIIYERKKLNPNYKLNLTFMLYSLIIATFLIFILVFHHVISIISMTLQFIFILTLAANDILIPFIFKGNMSLSQSVNEYAKEQNQSNVLTLLTKKSKKTLPIYIILFMISMSISHIFGGITAMTTKLDLTCNGKAIYKTQDSSVIVKIENNKYRVVPIDSCLIEKMIK